MDLFTVTRRRVLGLALGLVAALCNVAVPISASAQTNPVPVVFVHGNGDTAALWQVVMWRFESNGYPRNRLFAIDLRNPSARTDNNIPEAGKSGTEDVKAQLSDYAAWVRRVTGAPKVALVGNSRGANTIRNYVKNGGGAAVVSHVVLGGGVNHGVYDNPAVLPNFEFNGASSFMKQLNAGPNEVVAGVRFFTIRSDRFDLYAQPDGRFVFGTPGVPTGVSYDAPALKGARANVIVAKADHREASYAPRAFAHTYKFITGNEPASLAIKREAKSPLSGRITGITAGLYNNIGVEGAKLTIYPVNRETGVRLGGPVYTQTTGARGEWGPFLADPTTGYEFVVRVPGQPVTHIYRSPFPRGSKVIHLRPAQTVSDPGEGSVVILTRPRGYFGVDDTVGFNGRRPDLSTDPVPNESAVTIRVPFAAESHRARFEDELIGLRNWPSGHVAIAEFSY